MQGMAFNRKTLILLGVLLQGSVLQAGEADKSKVVPVDLNTYVGRTIDGPELAYRLMQTFLSNEEFERRAKVLEDRAKTWAKDNGGDIGRYLNDRLIGVAMQAKNGDIEKLQHGITWLAFYKAFNQQAHPTVIKFLDEHRGTLTELFSPFTWEKASQYVKDKTWRKDIEARKQAREVEKSASNER